MVILLILKHIQKQWRIALHTLLQNIQVKQKNVHTMVHLKKEHMVGLLGLENITTQEQEWKTGVQFLLILDVNGELTEQKQYLLGGVLTVILQDLLEPITEVDSSQTKKQRIVKSFAFFTSVPSMALILLVKVRSRVFTAKCSEPQVGTSNGMDEGSGVTKFLSLRTET